MGSALLRLASMSVSRLSTTDLCGCAKTDMLKRKIRANRHNRYKFKKPCYPLRGALSPEPCASLTAIIKAH